MSDPVVGGLSAPLALNLRRLFVLRSVELLAQAATIGHAVLGLGLRLPLLPIVAIVAGFALFNIYTGLRLRSVRPVSPTEFFLQLVLDVLALTGLLYFTGGSTNPFVSLLLLPLVIVAATLPRAYAWCMAALTVGCYTLLMHFYVPLPHIDRSYIADFDLHIFGMWFGFLLSVGLVIFFVLQMANSLRERDRVLAEARERALRDENLIALGTLAAGTAHELGTPLSTIAVLAKELERENGGAPGLAEKTRILREQVERCKKILAGISERAGQARAESGRGMALDRYLEEVLAEWHALRPQVPLHCELRGTRPAPHIVIDKTLNQALINILNNAADATVEDVEVHGEWSAERLVFDVCDRGAGLAPAAQAAAGEPFFTTKKDGHGLGLFLSKAVIGRFGGSVQLLDREQGGLCTRIVLPLAKLSTTAL